MRGGVAVIDIELPALGLTATEGEQSEGIPLPK